MHTSPAAHTILAIRRVGQAARNNTIHRCQNTLSSHATREVLTQHEKFNNCPHPYLTVGTERTKHERATENTPPGFYNSLQLSPSKACKGDCFIDYSLLLSSASTRRLTDAFI